MRRIERNVGASHITFMRPHWSPSFPRGYSEWLLYSEYGKALASSVLPEDVCFHPRWLRFGQSCSHLIARNLQTSSYNAFASCLLSRHAVVPFSFRNRVSSEPDVQAFQASGSPVAAPLPLACPHFA